MATVSEEDAFAVATAWRRQLRGCVRLHIEPSPPATILQKCEWVTFKMDTSASYFTDTFHRKRFAYARATALAWFALSCCDGYSSTENPRFWKRILSRWDDQTLAWNDSIPPVENAGEDHQPHEELVLRELFRAARGRADEEEETKQSLRGLRFFPDATKPFPRLQLKQGDEVGGLGERIFLGLVAFPDEARDAELQRILKKLAPFIRPRHWTRRVPVWVDVVDLMDVPIVLAGLAADTSPNVVETEPGGSMEFSQMQVAGIMADRWVSSSALFQVEKQLLPCDIDVMITCVELQRLIQDDGLLQSLVGRQRRRGRAIKSPQWRISRVQLDMASTSHVAVLCSALPHSATIRDLELVYRDDGKSKSSAEASNWAWLGYAIFHPDAASQSAVESLELDIRGVSQAGLTALESMAEGNNLLWHSKTTVSSSEYVEGFVGPDSEVWSLPGVAEAKLQCRHSDVWLSLCVASSGEFEWDREWVRVVNTGFGFGWLQTSDIIEIQSRPPGKPCVKGLCVSTVEAIGAGSIQAGGSSKLLTLGVNADSQRRRDERVRTLLSCVGGNLEALDLKGSKHLTTPTLQAVLAPCPLLTRLRAGYNGDLWAHCDQNLAKTWTQFEELDLEVTTPVSHGYDDAMRPLHHDQTVEALSKIQSPHPACLPHLKALRLNATRGESFIKHKNALVEFLQRQRRVEFLTWSRGQRSRRRRSEGPEADSKLEFTREIQESSLRFAYVPIRLAFLSVIHGEKFSALRFGDDLVMLIFKFAVCPIEREVHVDL